MGPVADGAGVTTEEGDGVRATVGCGVLGVAAGLAGAVRAVGRGVVAGRDVEGTALGEAVDCVGVGETVASRCGLTSR